jgi:hypothetical protein
MAGEMGGDYFILRRVRRGCRVAVDEVCFLRV